MCLTNKYLDILNFVEEHGAITIDIAKELFYNTQYGYDSSRRALKSLVSANYLNISKDFVTGKNIYYSKKSISSHKLMLLRLYSRIISIGAEVIEFKKEYKANNYISDGLIIYKFNGKIKIVLVEVDINNKTKESKYVEIYESGYYQRTFGTFPRIMVIDKNAEARKKKKGEKRINFEYIDYEFRGVENIL